MYFQIERRVSDFLRLECREKKSVNTNLHGKQSGGKKMAKNKFSFPKNGKMIANAVNLIRIYLSIDLKTL